jgi:hypothetical protein
MPIDIHGMLSTFNPASTLLDPRLPAWTRYKVYLRCPDTTLTQDRGLGLTVSLVLRCLTLCFTKALQRLYSSLQQFTAAQPSPSGPTKAADRDRSHRRLPYVSEVNFSLGTDCELLGPVWTGLDLSGRVRSRAVIRRDIFDVDHPAIICLISETGQGR